MKEGRLQDVKGSEFCTLDPCAKPCDGTADPGCGHYEPVIDLSPIFGVVAMPCGRCMTDSTLCGMIGLCWRWLEE
jgi:hypothetical protein